MVINLCFIVNGSCPDGWKYYNKHCYKHFFMSKRWSEAQFYCTRFGANLVSIHDDREQDFLLNLYKQRTSYWIWTGLFKVHLKFLFNN